MPRILFLLLLCISISSFADDYFDESTNHVREPKVYALYNGIELTTKKDVTYDKPRIVIKLVFPVLTSDEFDNDNIEEFNNQVRSILDDEIKTFKDRLTENAALQNHLSKSGVKNELSIDYDASYVRSNQHHLISVRFSLLGYIAGMAHPYHQHRVLNYDLDHAQVLELNDLFRQDAPYLSVIARDAEKNLSRRLADKKMVQTGLSETNAYRHWNIKSNGLLFTFEEYQVAPYVFGAQTVLIPFSSLKPYISKRSPIYACAKSKYACRNSNILTGGFIDEATNTLNTTFNPILGQL